MSQQTACVQPESSEGPAVEARWPGHIWGSHVSMSGFRVDLEIFRGPLELLLYLVRKHELEITEISIVAVAEQYIEHLALLKQIDVNAVGDFLELASTLIEIKCRWLLPQDDAEETLDDPREDLVERLLEYKAYRDAAAILEDRRRGWQERFARAVDDVPPRRRDLAEEPIREVELWDLVSAFGRVLRENEAIRPSNIVYDDTPIHVFIGRIEKRIRVEGHLAFSQLFATAVHRSTMIGMFLAILELVRHQRVRAEQNDVFGELWIFPGPCIDAPFDPALADEVTSASPVDGDGTAGVGDDEGAAGVGDEVSRNRPR